MSEFRPFKNIKAFVCPDNSPIRSYTAENFEELLGKIPFERAANEKTRSGWEFPHNDFRTFVAASGSNYLFCLKTETKKIDNSEKKMLVDEKIKLWQEHNPEAKIPKAKKKEFESEVVNYLYREKFISKFNVQYGWFNKDNGLLIVDTSSDKSAGQFIDMLEKSASLANNESVEFLFDALLVSNEICFDLAQWVNEADSIPEYLELGNDLVLMGGADSIANGSRITYSKQPLDKDERLCEYLNSGYNIVKIRLSYDSLNFAEVDESEEEVDKSDHMDATFQLSSNATLSSFKLGSCYKYILKQNEYDTPAAQFDIEFDSFAKITLSILLKLYETFGGIVTPEDIE